jgi:hypothetical protein
MFLSLVLAVLVVLVGRTTVTAAAVEVGKSYLLLAPTCQQVPTQ